MGIRKRIRLGFFALGMLLFIAAIISYFELSKLNNSIKDVVDKGAASVTMSRSILDVMASQDELVVKYISDMDSTMFLIGNDISLRDINSLMEQVKSQYPHSEMLPPLQSAAKGYTDVITQFRGATKYDNVTWYLTTYKGSYNFLVLAVKEFMTDIQQEVVREVAYFDNSAYRSIMQGIISISVMILLLCVLFFMIDIYFIKPVVGMTKGLKNYLTHNVPFNVTVEGREEIFQLKEHIEQLITNIKNLKRRV